LAQTMQRGGAGLDRGGHRAPTGGQGGNRRDYHRGYRPDQSGYGGGYVGNADSPGGGDDYDRNGPERQRNNGGGNFCNGHDTYGSKSDSGGNQQRGVQQGLIADLESKLSAAHQEMSQALQEATSKENEKFDLIFSILVELQKRQAQLEESVRSVKAQLGAGADQEPQQGHQGSRQGQQYGQQQLQQAPQQSRQANGQQLGQPMGGGYVGGQVPMSQQYGAVAADGSQAYFAPVVVAAMPQGGPTMPYVQQMMSPPGPMQQMPQHMPMQFVSQGRPCDDYQWGNAGAGTGNMQGPAVGQPAEMVQQEQRPAAGGGEERKAGPWIEEE